MLKSEITKVFELFCPSAPMTDPAGFVGRETECVNLSQAILAPGRHAIVFGERGVGKTSTVKFVAKGLCEAENFLFIEYSCSSKDTHVEISHKILEEIDLLSVARVEQKMIEQTINAEVKIPIAHGGVASKKTTYTKFSDLVAEGMLTADRLSTLIAKRRIIVLFDEYDRIECADTKLFFAETIKSLSDCRSDCKFVISGVSNSAIGLSGDHISNIRNIRSIHIPKMLDRELLEIINHGSHELGISFSPELIRTILFLSQGLPYFTHLLCEELAIYAISQSTPNVDLDCLRQIIANVASNVSETIAQSYEMAVADIDSFDDFGPSGYKNADLPVQIRKLVLYGTAISNSGKLLGITETTARLVDLVGASLPDGHIDLTPDIVVVVATEIERISGCITLRGGSDIEFINPFFRSFCLFKAMETHPEISTLELLRIASNDV